MPATAEVFHLTIRQEWGRVVAVLVRELRDLDLAEDCAQEAALRALQRWPVSGVPERPGAWLLVTARRHAIDLMRRQSRLADKLELLASEARRTEAALLQGDDAYPTPGERLLEDDQLALIFGCCHPALGLDTQVALTLRSLGGLSTAEVAHAFFVPEATMAQRLVRAKQKIRKAGLPFRVPTPSGPPERVEAVLAVIYLVFNEGYSASGGQTTIRPDLVEEALRLAELLARLRPEDPEVLGLQALLLLTDARRPARTDAAGELVALEDQDRQRWDQTKIKEGLRVLAGAAELDQTGPYQLQAAIAAVHDRASSAAGTNWQAIVALYDALLDTGPSPIVALSRAVAVAFGGAPQQGLDQVEALAQPLGQHHLWHAARADLLRRLGRLEAAAEAYEHAAHLAPTAAERHFLRRRLTSLSQTISPPDRWAQPASIQQPALPQIGRYAAFDEPFRAEDEGE